MIRIVCPFCHAPLALQELETASIDNHACLVCPEYENVLASEEATDAHAKQGSSQKTENKAR